MNQVLTTHIENLLADKQERANHPPYLAVGNILAEKVRRAKKITTQTEADLGWHREPLQFSVEGAIRAQVEREDLIRWSQRKEEPKLVASLPEPSRPTYMALWSFMKNVIP